MTAIKDSFGHTLCMGNPREGIIEIKYRQISVTLHINIGEQISVCREGILSVITRLSCAAFIVSTFSS